MGRGHVAILTEISFPVQTMERIIAIQRSGLPFQNGFSFHLVYGCECQPALVWAITQGKGFPILSGEYHAKRKAAIRFKQSMGTGSFVDLVVMASSSRLWHRSSQCPS